ncbi:hypothetical protein CYMTET_29911 [Cymbomonas tetramitiformis]|uniref:Uncharacterized protein n=1 Tax=Cymbomonas tetramitiformis TaxID=36881 RepID=A0AAE0FLG0_9CHLO|nr:hypothetical protein CYMTET_29911 [Cymbomonas tetramitiformis]
MRQLSCVPGTTQVLKCEGSTTDLPLRKPRDVNQTIASIASETDVNLLSTRRGGKDGLERLKRMVLGTPLPTVCDSTFSERVANVLTSIPFMVLGVNNIRNARRASKTYKLYSAALVGAGGAALAFHTPANSDPIKPALRKLDHLAIGALGIATARCANPALPLSWTLASAAMLPFHPQGVAGANLLLTERAFLQKAAGNAGFRATYQKHLIVGTVAAAAFIGEELWPDVPCLHATWHVAAAVAMNCVDSFLCK